MPYSAVKLCVDNAELADFATAALAYGNLGRLPEFTGKAAEVWEKVKREIDIENEQRKIAAKRKSEQRYARIFGRQIKEKEGE